MKKRNVVILMMLCLCMILMLVPSVSKAEDTVIPAAEVLDNLNKNYIDKSGYGRYDGLCLTFVADFWKNYAGYRVSDTSAYDFSQRKVTVNPYYDIPIGADVFFDGWATTEYGWERVGHIGIYIGNGRFASAAGGKEVCIVVRNIAEYRTYTRNGSLAVQYMGWAWHPGIRVSSKATLDVNGYLDGKNVNNVYDYGSFSIYINGKKDKSKVGDYWNTELKTGTTYKIKNVKAANGKVFAGFKKGTYTGTLNKDETIVLEFRTINPEKWIKNHAPTLERTYNGHTYRYYSDKVTWWEAYYICNQLGGYLVAVGSKNENTFVNSMIKETIWIGATDLVKEGSFRLVNGLNQISYANWAAGEPNNHSGNAESGEDYCSIYGPETSLSGQWNDIYSYAQYGFVCEINKDTSKYTLDVNGWLDGRELDNLRGIASFTSVVNGKTENAVDDYYHTSLSYGSKYSFSDIKAASDYEFVGVKSGSLKGTLTGNTKIILEFRKKNPTPAKVTLDVNGWVDGKELDNIKGIGTFDSYINGKKTENDIDDYYNTILPNGTKYRIKDIKAVNGYEFVGVRSGSLSGTMQDNTKIILEFRKPSFTFVVESSKYKVGATYAQLGYFKVYSSIDIRRVKRIGCILYASDKTYLASDEEDAYVVGNHLTHYFHISDDSNEEDIRYRLTPGTVYWARAYIIYRGERYYSDWLMFTTEKVNGEWDASNLD